jgi:hypothetical protein
MKPLCPFPWKEIYREGVTMLTNERIKRFKQYKDNVDLRHEAMVYGWLEECIAEIERLRLVEEFTIKEEK